jgi:hypothetical protein
MAHALTITESGTINLASTATSGVYIRLMEYTPQVGMEIGDNATIVESAQIEIVGTAASDINAVYGSINRYLHQARLWQNSTAGTPVFLNYQPDGYTSSFRSEMLDGQIQIVNGGMNYPRWNSYRALCDITWQRRNYWEGTLTAATLSNPNGTTAAGLSMFIVNDGTAVGSNTRRNYANIASNQITGDLPAPAKIEMDGTTDLVTARNFYLTNTFSSNSGTNGFCVFIETNTMGSVAGYMFPGTATAGTGKYSNSDARYGTITVGSTMAMVGTITSANLAGVGGQNVAVFLGGQIDYAQVTTHVTATSGSDVYYRADWAVNLGDPIYTIMTSPWVGIDPTYQGAEAFAPLLFGVVKHPFYDHATYPVYDEKITVYAKCGGTANIPTLLDYVAFVAFDSIVYAGTYSNTYGATAPTVIDPYVGGVSYVDNVAPGNYISSFISPVGMLHLYPNKNQQVRVWGMREYDEDLGRFTLKLSYRPRRLAL